MELDQKPTGNINTLLSSPITNDTKTSPSHKFSTKKKDPRYETSPTLDYSLTVSPSSNNKKKKPLLFSRYHGISNTKSASTLQFSSTLWGFSKSDRFPKENNKMPWKFYDIPSTLKKKYTTFGYGQKTVMADVYLRQAYDVPASNHYVLKPCISLDSEKGKTFGLSYSAYTKMFLPNMDMQSPEIAKKLPGPGQYKVNEDIGSAKRKTTLKSRVKWFYEETKPQAPPANYYCPITTIVSPSRYKDITQGFGKRSNFLQIRIDTPGPGTYTLSSPFNKFDKVEEKSKKNSRVQTENNTKSRRRKKLEEDLNNEELFNVLRKNIANEELNPFKEEKDNETNEEQQTQDTKNNEILESQISFYYELCGTLKNHPTWILCICGMIYYALLNMKSK